MVICVLFLSVLRCSQVVAASLAEVCSSVLIVSNIMRFTSLIPASLALLSAAYGQSTAAPGYAPNVLSTVTNASFSFGQHYAVLNLDLIEGLVSGINTTTAGQAFINNIKTWVDAVQQQTPAPISLWTRIYFSNSQQPEIGPNTPFRKVAGSLPNNGTESSPATQIYHAFSPLPDYDVILRKSRYYAGDGNSLEEILSSQGIDTVILSGIRTSGVILSTVYHLFDLNYNVYVISNNTIESAPDTPGIEAAILEGIIPKLPANVITIEQALSALSRSGPAIY
jgi:nicotinamidase-related amidase